MYLPQHVVKLKKATPNVLGKTESYCDLKYAFMLIFLFIVFKLRRLETTSIIIKHVAFVLYIACSNKNKK